MKKLSIIIPVYNVEKYIERCINSALNQDLSKDEYEIIVVDDESPDNSAVIIKEIQKKYDNIKLFSQKNKGLGGARNTGLKNAKGKYILFLDADDYLKENTLRKIYEISTKNDLDILEFGAVGITKNNKIVYTKILKTEHVLSGYSYLDKFFYMNSACNKLYKLDFLRINKLQFIEKIYIEDFEFNTKVFYYAKRVLATDYIVSYFFQSHNSITRNSNPQKNLKMVNDINFVINELILFKRQIDINNKVNREVINERIGFLVVTLLYTLMKFRIDKDERDNIIKELKKNGVYPVKIVIRDKKKNIFKIFVNQTFLYKLGYNLHNFF